MDAVLTGRVTLLLSPPLRQELARVLRYPKLAAAFPDPDRIVTAREVARIISEQE